MILSANAIGILDLLCGSPPTILYFNAADVDVNHRSLCLCQIYCHRIRPWCQLLVLLGEKV